MEGHRVVAPRVEVAKAADTAAGMVAAKVGVAVASSAMLAAKSVVLPPA